jgi:LemA protein
MNKNLFTFKNILIGLGILALLLVMWFFSTKNSLITLQETNKASWAQVENQLQRRYDLIPNLINTVKGYATYEKEVFTNIAEARAKLAGAKNVNQKIAAAQGMESAISRLLMISENYPNLKADKNFSALMDELAGSENRIAQERRRFNENIRLYNQKIKMIPTSIVAQMSGFKEMNYFEMNDKAKEVPKVNF